MKQLPIAAAIAILGIGTARYLIATKPEAKKKEEVKQTQWVSTLEVHAKGESINVPAQGTVVPAQEIALQVEVGGRVVWQSPKLIPGGHFKKGEAILRIDSRDYALAVSQQQAQVDRARLEYELEEGRQSVAEEEWRRLNDGQDIDPETGALARREPHLRTAKVSVASAESLLDQAKLRLERTTLRAPFDGFIKNESVDLGQFLSPGLRVGTLTGSEHAWIQVSIPIKWLSTITLPSAAHPKGSKATIIHRVDDREIRREGEVLRLFGDVDPIGRMARILVQVDNPLEPVDGVPMLFGSYVDVVLEGAQLQESIEIPRLALKEGNRVWVLSKNETLEIHEVQVLWRRQNTVIVGAGLNDGEQIITSRIANPVEGMALKRRGVGMNAPALATGETQKEDTDKAPQGDGERALQ